MASNGKCSIVKLLLSQNNILVNKSDNFGDIPLTIACRNGKNEITKFVSEPDNGIFHAMNKGWELASGEYIMFLNSDDFLANGSLKSMVDFAHITHDPSREKEQTEIQKHFFQT